MGLAALTLQGAPGLPFAQVAPGTAHVVFYRIEGDHQFLFVYGMPGRRLLALEIDRRGAEGDEPEGDEAGEIVHHLPLSHLSGRIQFLPVDRLPVPRGQLMKMLGMTRAVFQGVTLDAAGSTRDRWLGRSRELPSAP